MMAYLFIGLLALILCLGLRVCVRCCFEASHRDNLDVLLMDSQLKKGWTSVLIGQNCANLCAYSQTPWIIFSARGCAHVAPHTHVSLEGHVTDYSTAEEEWYIELATEYPLALCESWAEECLQWVKAKDVASEGVVEKLVPVGWFGNSLVKQNLLKQLRNFVQSPSRSRSRTEKQGSSVRLSGRRKFFQERRSEKGKTKLVLAG